MILSKEENMLISDRRTYAPVSIVRTLPQKEQVLEDVKKAMRLSNWRDFVSHGADIALKPNLGWDKLISGAISAPWVVEAVILTIRDYVGKIFLVESNQVVVDVEKALKLSGLDEVCRRLDVTWVNMSKGNYVKIKTSDGLVLQEINIPEILTNTELITLPLLKTHNKTVISGAIKNQWGCLQELRHNYHPILPQALVDINRVLQPRFAVMDGTVGLEGDGPKSGIPKEMNLILASGNLVGLDAVGARLMGFDPINLGFLKLCSENGLGPMNGSLTIKGESVEDIRNNFLPAKHNPVSWLELVLRKPLIEWLVFKTPFLKIPAWGARRYYDFWYYFVGKKLREDFFQKSGYAAQWKH